MTDETDDEAPAVGSEWDVAATHALADLLRAAHPLEPDTRLRTAANRAAEAMAKAIEDYHTPTQAAEVRH
jgi:hypothetical protein